MHVWAGNFPYRPILHPAGLDPFFGDKGVAQEIVDSLRKLQMDHHDLGNGDYVRSRIDVPLDPESDNLF